MRGEGLKPFAQTVRVESRVQEKRMKRTSIGLAIAVALAVLALVLLHKPVPEPHEWKTIYGPTAEQPLPPDLASVRDSWAELAKAQAEVIEEEKRTGQWPAPAGYSPSGKSLADVDINDPRVRRIVEFEVEQYECREEGKCR
jgi:hypothetical protein